MVQRVNKAVVKCEGEVTAEIGKGLLVLIGIGAQDGDEDVAYMAEKLAHLRIFEGEGGKMSHSALELGLPILVVPNFTLYGDCRKGRRPDFSFAASKELAEGLFKAVVEGIRERGVTAVAAPFGARMEVELVNDGPVTVLIDSKRIF